MKSSIQKPFCTTMVLKFLTFLVVLSLGTAMDSPKEEFGVADLVSLGIFSSSGSSSGNRPSVAKGVANNVGGTSSLKTTVTQRALLIATAKLGNKSPHPSTPYLTIDVTQSSPGCGPFDWIFRPDCLAPRINMRVNPVSVGGQIRQELSTSFLYAFKLPDGAENLRVTLPNYSSCGRDGDNSRTGTFRILTSGILCNRARFRRRSCRRRLIVFKKCSLMDCDTLTFLSRLVSFGPSGTTTVPYIASGTGFETCRPEEIPELFLI